MSRSLSASCYQYVQQIIVSLSHYCRYQYQHHRVVIVFLHVKNCFQFVYHVCDKTNNPKQAINKRTWQVGGQDGPILKMWVEGVSVGYPGKKNEESASSRLTPRECRERGLSYQGSLLVDLCYQVQHDLHVYVYDCCCTYHSRVPV